MFYSVPSIAYENPLWECSLYGVRIPFCDSIVAKNIEESKPPVLESGSIFYANGKFAVEKALGPRTYLLKMVGGDEQRVLKIESSNRTRIGPFLNRHVAVANEANRRFGIYPKTQFGKQFLKVFECGKYGENAIYIMQEIADCNLQDMMVRTMEGATPSRSTALHVSLLT